MSEIKFGFYSKKSQDAANGRAHVYRRPDGRTVIVTEIGSSRQSESSWDDNSCLGEVTEWLKETHEYPCDCGGRTANTTCNPDWCSSLNANPSGKDPPEKIIEKEDHQYYNRRPYNRRTS